MSSDREDVPSLQRFNHLCGELRTVAGLISKASKDKNDQDLGPLLARSAAYFMDLKVANRGANACVNELQSLSRARKEQMDLCHMELRALKYEEQTLLSDINLCRRVDTTHLSKSGVETVDTSDIGQHTLQLAKLSEELQSRRRSLKILEDTKKRRAMLQKKLDSQNKFLLGLPDQFSLLEKAAEPLQQYVSLPAHARVRRPTAVQRLPSPLYLLFCHLQACIPETEESGNVTATAPLPGFESFSMESKDLEFMSVDVVNEMGEVEDEQVGGDMTIVNEGGKRSAPASISAVDMKKRQKGVAGESQYGSHLGVREEEAEVLFRPHTASVQLCLGRRCTPNDDDEDAPPASAAVNASRALLTLRFRFFSHLNIATVEAEKKGGEGSADGDGGGDGDGGDEDWAQTLLETLYVGDSGLESPNLANKHIRVKTGQQGVPQDFYLPDDLPGRPYHWLQRACGLVFPRPPATHGAGVAVVKKKKGDKQQLQQQQLPSVPAVVARFRQRLKQCYDDVDQE